jgi:hypothetical protein
MTFLLLFTHFYVTKRVQTPNSSRICKTRGGGALWTHVPQAQAGMRKGVRLLFSVSLVWVIARCKPHASTHPLSLMFTPMNMHASWRFAIDFNDAKHRPLPLFHACTTRRTGNSDDQMMPPCWDQECRSIAFLLILNPCHSSVHHH